MEVLRSVTKLAIVVAIVFATACADALTAPAPPALAENGFIVSNTGGAPQTFDILWESVCGGPQFVAGTYTVHLPTLVKSWSDGRLEVRQQAAGHGTLYDVGGLAYQFSNRVSFRQIGTGDSYTAILEIVYRITPRGPVQNEYVKLILTIVQDGEDFGVDQVFATNCFGPG